MQIINLDGINTQTAKFLWTEATGVGTPIYTFLLDYKGNDFSDPILELSSDNKGVSPYITFTFKFLNSLLDKISKESEYFIWTVKIDDEWSENEQTIQIIKGKLVNQYDLAFSAITQSATIDVDGLGSRLVDFHWLPASNEVVDYKFYLLKSDLTWSEDWSLSSQSPIYNHVWNNNNTNLSLSLNWLDDYIYIHRGATAADQKITTKWKVVANNNSIELDSTSYWDLTLISGLIYNLFDLLTPATRTILALSGDPNEPINFSWEEAGNSSYSLILTERNAGWVTFSTTNHIESTNETSFSMNRLFFDDLVVNTFGFTTGGSIDWTVRAKQRNGLIRYPGSDENNPQTTIGKHVLAFIRGTYYITTTAPLGLLELNGSGDQTVRFEWERLLAPFGTASYNFSYYYNGSETSYSVGTNTYYDITYTELDNLTAGVPENDIVNLDWIVTGNYLSSISVTMSISSVIQNLQIQKGNVINNYSLLTPANNATLTLNGASDAEIIFDWEDITTTSGSGTFNLIAPTSGNNYSITNTTLPPSPITFEWEPYLSNAYEIIFFDDINIAGVFNATTVSQNVSYQWVYNNLLTGISVGQTAEYTWTIRHAGLTYANSQRNISFTKA